MTSAIERLRATHQRWTKFDMSMLSEEAEISRALPALLDCAEALEAFARSRERDWDEDAPDDTEVWNSQGSGWGTERTCLTVGDFSKARAALDALASGLD